MSLPTESEITMTDKDVLDIHVLVRRKFNLMSQVLDLSKQMGDSIDRNDESNLKKLFVERDDPIEKAKEVHEEIIHKVNGFRPKDVTHIWKVIAGEVHNTKAEAALQKQALATQKVTKEVLQLDERLNKRIFGQDSLYTKNNQGKTSS